jgi:TatD DNase family protein
MLFDTHTHYDDKKFDEDRDLIIQNAYNNGISYILNASSSPESIDNTIDLAVRYTNMFCSVGVHPHNASEMNNNILNKIRKAVNNSKVVAIGEIGLDYHYDFSPREVQIDCFMKQLELAKELNYPVIIHNRESTKDMLNIMEKTSIKAVGGVFHCFSGDIETAKILLNNNFYLSFGGPVTFKNARKSIDVIKFVPLERILLETDCPYLTPEPFRGKRNDSSFLKLVAEMIASTKNISYQEVADTTTTNALDLFRISVK